LDSLDDDVSEEAPKKSSLCAMSRSFVRLLLKHHQTSSMVSLEDAVNSLQSDPDDTSSREFVPLHHLPSFLLWFGLWFWGFFFFF
jgi:hypothetical protein